MIERYNRTTRALLSLCIGTAVLVQNSNTKRWDKLGYIVKCQDQKYEITMSGSDRVITRNRKFIKPVHFNVDNGVKTKLLNSVPCTSKNQVHPVDNVVTIANQSTDQLSSVIPDLSSE